jgi:hypothetical protein
MCTYSYIHIIFVLIHKYDLKPSKLLVQGHILKQQLYFYVMTYLYLTMRCLTVAYQTHNV